MDERRKPSLVLRSVVALVAASLLYLLSVAPFYWLHTRDYFSDAAAERVGRIYAPVWWAAQRFPAVRPAFLWYMDRWMAPPILPVFPSPG